MSWIDNLKKKWNVNSVWDVFIILIVFACTGFTIIAIKRLFGVNADTQLFWRITFYVFVFLIYQLILLFYGFIFGKFKFFYEFEKRMLKRIGSIFVKRK